MNPNLTPVQRAARNLFAAETGINDSAAVELTFLNPIVRSMAEEMAGNLLDGPFGTFAPVDAELTAEPCVCPALDSYVAALNECRELLTGVTVGGGVTEATRAVVDSVLKALDTAIADRIAVVTGDATEEQDPLADIISAMLGRVVRVYRL